MLPLRSASQLLVRAGPECIRVFDVLLADLACFSVVTSSSHAGGLHGIPAADKEDVQVASQLHGAVSAAAHVQQVLDSAESEHDHDSVVAAAEPQSKRMELLGADHAHVRLEFGEQAAQFAALPLEHGFTVASSGHSGGALAPAEELKQAVQIAAKEQQDKADDSPGLLHCLSRSILGQHEQASFAFTISPAAPRHVLLQRGSALLQLGAYSAALECLTVANEHSAAMGDNALLAATYAALAELKAAQLCPEAAVELIQKAQKLGGSLELWHNLLLQYIKYRCDLTLATALATARDMAHCTP